MRRAGNQLARLTELALTLALIICAIPLLMVQWGFQGADIRDWFKSLVFGLEIGTFRISLARILIGIVLFIALLFATRLFQRWLRERALQQTRMDPGIVNSIDTVVGYAGIAIASLLAISYAGFDITNLAIVAGALSIGVGFGLQSIVNNFVSGLILLVERPVKVGDRVVIGDQQGIVRRISVRATEVETFDRASLIVPNSELITGRVLNWTHRDSLGGATVRIGVTYDADPEQVLGILRACANAHPEVLRIPEPGAILERFGDNALIFALGITVADLSKSAGVQSDLRVAILKALRAADIEIPFNQVDVNLRDLDGVKRYIAHQLEAEGRRPSRGADQQRQARPPARQLASAETCFALRCNALPLLTLRGGDPLSRTASCSRPSTLPKIRMATSSTPSAWPSRAARLAGARPLTRPIRAVAPTTSGETALAISICMVRKCTGPRPATCLGSGFE